MKISEFLHKNDQKTHENLKKWGGIIVKIGIYVLLIYTIGKMAYAVILGTKIASKILGCFLV